MLCVWLPLNGDLHNQGLSKITFSALTTNTSINTSGKIGACYQNNSHSAGGLISNTVIDLGAKQSMFCWFKFTDLEASSSLGGGLVSQHRYQSNKGMGITIKYVSSTTGYLSVNTGNGSNRTYNTYCGTTLLQANTWYHGGYTYDGNSIRIYLNGILEKTQSFTGMSVPAEYLTVFCWSMSGTSGNTIHSDYKLNGCINDVRVYDHCLSDKEVEEISKGLILHYQLNNGNHNLLSEYVTPGQGAPGATSTGGRTNYYGKYGIIIPATENADTYFRLFLKQQLVQGTTYTISCYVSGLLPGSYYNFPLFAQGNTSMGILQLNHNGLCSLTFTMNSSSQSAVTTPEGDTVYVCFMDDAGRTLTSGQGAITINGFKLEQGNNVTNFSSIDNNIIYDASGYNNNGTINDTSVTPVNISSKYLNCIKNSQTNNSATYLAKGNINMPESSALTFSWWMNPSTIGVQTSGIFSTSASDLPTDYSTTAANMRDSCFDCCNTSGTCVRINVESYLTLNEWHHYALTYNGSKLIFYKDGIQKTTANQTGNLKSFTSIFPFYSKAGGLNRTTSGLLSDFRIYATALTSAQIKELYETSKIVDGTTVKARDLEVSA